jgi:hypothetical protein
MHILDSCKDLKSDHNRSWQVEHPITSHEQVLQRWTQQVHNHDIVIALGGGVVDLNRR